MTSLSPIDLLSMSAAEQGVLRCLTKQPQLTAVELAAQAKMSLAEVESVLHDLLNQARIVEQLHNGKQVFSTRFQFERRAVRNMPAGILNIFEPSPERFLADVPLTASLPTEVSNQLLHLSQKRNLLPDEVLAWQGQKTAWVGVVYNGLLIKTRLKGQQASEKAGYVQRGEWLGLSEAFSDTAVSETYTSVAETTMLIWSTTDFLAFVQQCSELAVSISRYFSLQLKSCEKSHLRGQRHLWVIEGAHPGAGVTTFVNNLALLARQSKSGRVLLWNLTNNTPHTSPKNHKGNGSTHASSLVKITKRPGGVDLLERLEARDYPPQVQLDILLTDLLARYQYIICDTGSNGRDEFLLRLRGQAQTLITLTQEENGAEAASKRWNQLQPYALPGQKRVLALNKATIPAIQADHKFQLIIPEDKNAQKNLVDVAPDSPLVEALREVYRRLSLNHALAIFVPSTMDVSQYISNSEQVQSALTFLGGIFGGATSSNAEGVWRSENEGLVTEQVTVVRTFVSKKALEAHLDDVIHFASDLKKAMKQEAVAISVDNQLILV